MTLIGRVAVVTGAAHGIGRGIAELLEELGVHVIAVDRDGEALGELARGGRCSPFPGDLAGEGVERLAQKIWSRHGPIDLLVNNVGIDAPQRFFELGPDHFDAVFGTNLRGPWFFTKRLAARLVEARRGGAIVFVGSLHDRFVRTHPHYSASKAAVAMLVKELARELAPHGIRVNAVSPGTVRTDTNRTSEEAQIQRMVPLGRIGEPADVARMTAVLLDDEWSGYVTGANVPVDGGLSLHSWIPAEPAPAPRRSALDMLLRRRRIRE